MSQSFSTDTQQALDLAQTSYADWQAAQGRVADAKNVSDSATQALGDATQAATQAQQKAFGDAQSAIGAVARELGVTVGQLSPLMPPAQAVGFRSTGRR